MKKFLLTVALFTFSLAGARAQLVTYDQLKADTTFHNLVEAEATKNYDAFVAPATLEVKAALTKTQFEASSDLLSPRLKVGYTIDSLGELNQRGLQVCLYRLRFKDGSDDMLGTMSLKDGQVAGIYFK